MLKRLRLECFKNFKEAELHLGPFTLLVGANASGKSNLRDAFRFLHGVGRGYSLPEIFGERWGEGGELQWQGIRGGALGAAFHGSDSFKLEVAFSPEYQTDEQPSTYGIRVQTGPAGQPPRLLEEYLLSPGRVPYVFDSRLIDQKDPDRISIKILIKRGGALVEKATTFDRTRPVLKQLWPCSLIWDDTDAETHAELFRPIRTVEKALERMRFHEWNPDAMRSPSFPGQNVLGDRGENLSSVLQGMCANEGKKKALLSWIEELTPMDVRDFEFLTDHLGRVLLMIVEGGGKKTSIAEASDGTLRFLAMLATILGAERPKLCFIEELENGVHPNRLFLLLQLIESHIKHQGDTTPEVQVVATTHSPFLLSLLRPEQRQNAALVYRLPHTTEGRIRQLTEIPEARRALEEQDLARLHASGWLEDMAGLAEEAEVAP